MKEEKCKDKHKDKKECKDKPETKDNYRKDTRNTKTNRIQTKQFTKITRGE
jgi:hypothetical protein